MATVVEERASVASGRGIRVGWVLGGLVALALAGVVVAAVAVLSGAPTIRPDAERVSPLYTADELALMRLVANGYIPAQTLDAEPFRTRGLVNQGLLPRAALEPKPELIGPLYSAQERALMAAVGAGLVPEETLDGEPFRTKRLINQGLIPRESADS